MNETTTPDALPTLAPVDAPAPVTVRILSIDAWRDTENGWTWNNWYKVGDAPLSLCDAGTRAILLYMRDAYLSQHSRGKLTVEDDGYNMVIMRRGTREPLFALEYGAVQS